MVRSSLFMPWPRCEGGAVTPPQPCSVRGNHCGWQLMPVENGSTALALGVPWMECGPKLLATPVRGESRPVSSAPGATTAQQHCLRQICFSASEVTLSAR
jgi:hypothetical protein